MQRTGSFLHMETRRCWRHSQFPLRIQHHQKPGYFSVQHYLVNRSGTSFAPQHSINKLLQCNCTVTVIKDVEECFAFMDVQIQGFLEICSDQRLVQSFHQIVFGDQTFTSRVDRTKDCCQFFCCILPFSGFFRLPNVPRHWLRRLGCPLETPL